MATCMQSLMECPVCMETYTSVNPPKRLNCPHTVCHSCLKSLLGQATNGLSCPICRANHDIPRMREAGYHNNLEIIALMDMGNMTPDETCPQCGEIGKLMDCTHCSAKLCVKCRINHLSSPSINLKAEERGCPVCRRKCQSLAKCTHCRSVICAACRVSHLRDESSSEVMKLKHRLPSMDERRRWQSYNRWNVEMREHYELVKTEINTCVDKHIQQIEDAKRMALEDIERRENALRDIPSAEYAAAEHFCATASQRVKTLENEAELKAITEQSRGLQDALPDVQADGFPASSKIKLHHDCDTLSQLLSDTIAVTEVPNSETPSWILPPCSRTALTALSPAILKLREIAQKRYS